MCRDTDIGDYERAILTAFKEYVEWCDHNMARTHDMTEKTKIDLFWNDHINQSQYEIAHLKQKLEQLEQAFRWYTDPANAGRWTQKDALAVLDAILKDYFT